MVGSLLAQLALAPVAVAAEFKVMSFNIWVGGTQHKPLSQTIEVIRRSGADIVGIQEPGPNLETIAKGLGWSVSTKASIVTKFAIVEDWAVPGSRWGGAQVRLPDGRTVYAYNTHLTAYPYGPYEVRDGKAKDEAAAVKVEEDSMRLPEMRAMLADIANRVPADAPLVFTGDFNTPSHLDWVEATNGRTFDRVVRWPVTVAAEQAGMKDAFRTIHLDPSKKPGFTWSPGYPVGKLEANDVMDRIDLVFFRGKGLAATGAWVVGETGPMTDLPVDPWPSDHRAVLAAFKLE